MPFHPQVSILHTHIYIGPQKSTRAGICKQAGCKGFHVSSRDFTAIESHFHQGPWVAHTGLLCTDRRRVCKTSRLLQLLVLNVNVVAFHSWATYAGGGWGLYINDMVYSLGRMASIGWNMPMQWVQWGARLRVTFRGYIHSAWYSAIFPHSCTAPPANLPIWEQGMHPCMVCSK